MPQLDSAHRQLLPPAHYQLPSPSTFSAHPKLKLSRSSRQICGAFLELVVGAQALAGLVGQGLW